MLPVKRDSIFRRRKSKELWAQKRNNAETSSELDEVPFKRTRVLLGLVGALPFTWKKPHSPSLHPTRSTLLLSAVIYFTLFICIHRAISTYGYRILTEDLPLYVAIMFSSYVIVCLYAMSTVAIIADVPAAQQALRQWLHLNSLYHKLTRRSPTLRWQPAETGLLFVVIFVVPGFLVVMKIALPELEVNFCDFVPVLHTCATLFSTSTLWIAHYSYLEDYAKDINKALYLNIRRGSLTPEKLQLYQETWAMIKELSDTISSLNAPFLAFLVSLVYLIFAIFEFILKFQAGMYSASLSVLFFWSSMIGLVTSMARSSDLAVSQLKDLYTVLLAQLDVDTMRSVPQYQVLSMFFVENVRSLIPSYGGFVRANKALIPSLLGAITINVVVLAQFTQTSRS